MGRWKKFVSRSESKDLEHFSKLRAEAKTSSSHLRKKLNLYMARLTFKLMVSEATVKTSLN